MVETQVKNTFSSAFVLFLSAFFKIFAAAEFEF